MMLTSTTTMKASTAVGRVNRIVSYRYFPMLRCGDLCFERLAAVMRR